MSIKNRKFCAKVKQPRTWTSNVAVSDETLWIAAEMTPFAVRIFRTHWAQSHTIRRDGSASSIDQLALYLVESVSLFAPLTTTCETSRAAHLPFHRLPIDRQLLETCMKYTQSVLPH